MTNLVQRRKGTVRPSGPDPFVLAASTWAPGSAAGGASALIEKIDEFLQRQYQATTWGLSGAVRSRGAAPPASGTTDRLAKLKLLTGLTWEQLSRLFGVSKRAVMHWSAGSRMSAGHEERLALLLTRANDAASRDAEALHAWLMTIDETGTAPFQRWIKEVRKTEWPAAWIDRQPQGQ